MPLVLYNSLTRRKEKFEPLDPERVRMYVCGPTVYDLAHIGNARAVVVFDLLYRVLRHEYGADHVRYVRNITDIDDKIIEAARQTDESIDSITALTTADFHYDMDALNALRPNEEPRATAHVGDMKAMIERLIATQHAYEAEGHVLFSVASWPSYGRLSRRSRQEMIAGARVEVAPYKRDPGDFVLWKPSTPDQPGWDSPWGRGRPGWHIECSAMSEANLGESFDIHGGGLDLIFPHHENELAQSESAHEGRKFANFWVHNGFLSVDGTKMSKSLGNFVTAHELLEKWNGDIIRLALLRTHYREPLDWTEERLRQAREEIDRFYRTLVGQGVPFETPGAVPKEVTEALDDDLNVHSAITHLHGLVRTINRSRDDGERRLLRAALRAGLDLIGMRTEGAPEWVQPGRPELVGKRVEDRTLARKERRFADADRIRAELAAEGVILEDKPDGTTEWRRA